MKSIYRKITTFFCFVFVFNVTLLYSQVYIDVTDSLGINAMLKQIDGFGAGVSFFDFNNDGWDDLTFTSQDDSIKFYLNIGGSFVKIPSFLYGMGNVKQVIWIDYNNNGFMDLFITTRNGPYKLYENDGNFNFTDISLQAGLSNVIGNTYGVSFADINKNGFLDIYIAKYEWGAPDTILDKNNQLYQNNGDGTFTNITFESGVGDGVKPSFQGVWLDYNNNVWPDLYVINDRTISGNSLYHNNGDGTFTNVTDSANVELFGMDPMSTSVADFNNNGFLDIYMTNTGYDGRKALLLENNGDGTFSEKAEHYGVNVDQEAWGSAWVDYNNNSYLDLFVCTSMSDSLSPKYPNFLYKSLQADTFILFTDSVFSHNLPTRSFGVAKGDFTQNGFYDLIVHNMAPYKSVLWKNTGGDNNWIKITLQGTASNSMAIGSWIKVFFGGNEYVHYTLCGEDYVSQSSQHQIFGLAQYTIVDSIQIEYSRGHIDTYYNLDVNQHYYFKEGETWEVKIDAPSDTIFLCSGDSVTLSFNNEFVSEFQWNNGTQTEIITVKQGGKFWVEAQNDFHVNKFSDTIHVINVNPPLVAKAIVNPRCATYQDGSISMYVQSSIDMLSIEWETGDTVKELTGLGAGTYQYTLTDIAGCIYTDSVTLIDPPALTVFVETTHAHSNELGLIHLVVTGGTPPYSVFLNDTLIEDFLIENVFPGLYNLTTIDKNGCEVTREIEIENLVGIEELKYENIKIYPNPIHNSSIKISSPIYENEIFELVVRNVLGQKVHSERVIFNAEGFYESAFIPNSAGVFYVYLKNQKNIHNFILVSH